MELVRQQPQVQPPHLQTQQPQTQQPQTQQPQTQVPQTPVPQQPRVPQPHVHQPPVGQPPVGQRPLGQPPVHQAPGQPQHTLQVHQPHQIGQHENREAKVFQIASDLFRQDPDWVTFFREVLGVDGIVRQVFNVPQDLARFEQTNEYSEIQQMVAKLRERASEPADAREPTRVITVRLPKSLHESLRTEAHERKTSMNKLCISKLLQMVDEDLIPND